MRYWLRDSASYSQLKDSKCKIFAIFFIKSLFNLCLLMPSDKLMKENMRHLHSCAQERGNYTFRLGGGGHHNRIEINIGCSKPRFLAGFRPLIFHPLIFSTKKYKKKQQKIYKKRKHLQKSAYSFSAKCRKYLCVSL